MAEIVLFEHEDFRGKHRHLFISEKNLNANIDHYWNDTVSSFVVVSGRWQFFRDSNFTGISSTIFTPGEYRSVEDAQFLDDEISSVKLVT